MSDRHAALLKQYGFECECPACKHDYRMNTSIDDNLQIEQFHNSQSIHAEVMKNWLEIETNFEKHTPHKTATAIAKNKFLLEIIGSKFM